MSGRFCILAVILVASLSAPSCKLFRRQPKVAAPAPPPRELRLPAPPKPEPARPISLPSPPEVAAQEPDLSQSPALTAQTGSSLPPRPRTPRLGRNSTKKGEATEAPSGAQLADESAAVVPQLEEVLTPEQQQSYNDAIERNIVRAQHTVDVLKTHRLSEQQSTYLERIRTFIEQAKDARKSDLFRAKNLAERASVLADDLLRGVQQQ
jgi:hypothetical protein